MMSESHSLLSLPRNDRLGGALMQACMSIEGGAHASSSLFTYDLAHDGRNRLMFAVREDLPLIPADPAVPRYLVCHIRSGSALLVLSGVPVPIAAPAVLLLNEVLRPEILHTRGLHMVTLYFHPALINSAFRLEVIQSEKGRGSLKGSSHQDLFLLERFFAAQPAERVMQLPAQVHERVKESIDQAAAEARTQPDKFWSCRVRAYLIETLFQLRLLQPAALPRLSAAGDAMRASRVARAMSFLQERYRSDFTLTEVASACCTNRTTLNTEFRAATGMTIRAYTISLRVKMAARMLRDTALPVAQIMSRVGYENPSHFTRAFRETLGTSPRDYRNNRSWANQQ